MVTDEMLEAAMKVFNEDDYRYQTWRDHVRAMIKAALEAAQSKAASEAIGRA